MREVNECVLRYSPEQRPDYPVSVFASSMENPRIPAAKDLGNADLESTPLDHEIRLSLRVSLKNGVDQRLSLP